MPVQAVHRLPVERTRRRALPRADLQQAGAGVAAAQLQGHAPGVPEVRHAPALAWLALVPAVLFLLAAVLLLLRRRVLLLLLLLLLSRDGLLQGDLLQGGPDLAGEAPHLEHVVLRGHAGRAPHGDAPELLGLLLAGGGGRFAGLQQQQLVPLLDLGHVLLCGRTSNGTRGGSV